MVTIQDSDLSPDCPFPPPDEAAAVELRPPRHQYSWGGGGAPHSHACVPEIIYAILTDSLQQWRIIRSAVISDQVGGNVGHTRLSTRQKKEKKGRNGHICPFDCPPGVPR
jgi:hypothetical protein